jgi:hypothetical protein
MAENQTTAVATIDRDQLPAPTFGAKMQLARLADALEFAKIIHASGLAPKGLNVEGVVIAMQMGYEVGLSPMQAVQNIASINGRPAIWGDAQLALVRASGLLEQYAQEAIGEPGTDGRGYRVTVKRTGNPPASEEFTVADAKRAGLWGKAGPWTQYPQRMLLFRARGFILRDQFGDVLKGLRSAEEVMDEPVEKDVTAAGSDRPAPESRLKAKREKAAEAPAAPAPEAQGEVKHEAPTNVVTPNELQSALDKTKTPNEWALRYAVSMRWIGEGQTLDDMPNALKARVVANPDGFSRTVSDYQNQHQGAKA